MIDVTEGARLPTGAEGAAGAFDNGARSGFNAWFFDRLDRYINHLSRAHKESAFAGIEPIRRAYRHAIEQRYRFYSYGDAMLVDKIHR